jgi:phosphatidate cytidylyltransferase
MNEKNRNLALRVASALLLFPLLVAVTWIGGFPFAILLACAAALGAFELVSMFDEVGAPELFGVAVAGLLPVATWFAATHSARGYPAIVPALVAVGAVALLTMNLFRPGPIEHAPRRAGISVLSWMYTGLLISTAAGLRVRFGFVWLMLAFVVSWLNDILAYFAGRFFGKTPLYPRVSPKKTWEGFAGGMAGSILGALGTKIVFRWLPCPAGEEFLLSWMGCVGVGIGAGVLGPIGDLAESMFKRAAGKKDSGRLIPGHGGLLDRIDALLFVLPWVYLWAAVGQ